MGLVFSSESRQAGGRRIPKLSQLSHQCFPLLDIIFFIVLIFCVTTIFFYHSLSLSPCQLYYHCNNIYVNTLVSLGRQAQKLFCPNQFFFLGFIFPDRFIEIMSFSALQTHAFSSVSLDRQQGSGSFFRFTQILLTFSV